MAEPQVPFLFAVCLSPCFETCCAQEAKKRRAGPAHPELCSIFPIEENGQGLRAQGVVQEAKWTASLDAPEAPGCSARGREGRKREGQKNGSRCADSEVSDEGLLRDPELWLYSRARPPNEGTWQGTGIILSFPTRPTSRLFTRLKWGRRPPLPHGICEVQPLLFCPWLRQKAHVDLEPPSKCLREVCAIQTGGDGDFGLGWIQILEFEIQEKNDGW
jgi:hypothetical protein